jgi:hypothetical protein
LNISPERVLAAFLNVHFGFETLYNCAKRACHNSHHAVLASEIEKELGKGSEKRGSEILLSMVKYNLLALRPPSTLARDLPQEVYGSGKKKTTVVTLPLPAHVWAAEVVLEELKEKE